ncbi:hypothetical protein ACFQMH_31550 [Streptomyces viridiviolaceus]|uniref:Uncharacterized protein n=1 Tax=Streptomyces viridiviolaceus TaxID=68282 RepID=A0ABW2E832_9ACTN|nr:hypothetical protein [Streptomyces viridiviolaceus]
MNQPNAVPPRRVTRLSWNLTADEVEQAGLSDLAHACCDQTATCEPAS